MRNVPVITRRINVGSIASFQRLYNSTRSCFVGRVCTLNFFYSVDPQSSVHHRGQIGDHRGGNIKIVVFLSKEELIATNSG